MWKKLLAWILVTVILTGYGIQIVEAFDQKENVRMEKVIEKPDQNSLYAKAAVLMDADSGRILYEKNGHQAMANASTTKILTCIIALENCDLDSEVTVSALAASQPKVHLGMREGQKFYLKDLLYGLMLQSGNDCAVALACLTSGSVENFAMLMNHVARKAGASDSHFANPHGLPDDKHFSTARDMAAISSFAMANETFRSIVSTKVYKDCPYAGRDYNRVITNKNKMLTMLEGGNGIKTGYTKAAGRCLISSAERDGKEVICVVLSCGPMFEESCGLIEDAFSELENG